MRASKTGRKRKDGIVTVDGVQMTSQEQRILASQRSAEARKLTEVEEIYIDILRHEGYSYDKISILSGVPKTTLYRYLTSPKVTHQRSWRNK